MNLLGYYYTRNFNVTQNRGKDLRKNIKVKSFSTIVTGFCSAAKSSWEFSNQMKFDFKQH